MCGRYRLSRRKQLIVPMPAEVRIYECKKCGIQLEQFRSDLSEFDLPEEDWRPRLCTKCRFLQRLNNSLAERHLSQPRPFGSPPEERLWHAMSEEFRRDEIHIFNQVCTIYSYTLDFYFAEFRLAVEIDGKAFHDSLKDAHRDDVHLRECGIKTLRFLPAKSGTPRPVSFLESGQPFRNKTGLLFQHCDQLNRKMERSAAGTICFERGYAPHLQEYLSRMARTNAFAADWLSYSGCFLIHSTKTLAASFT
jgi:very-short-patch-repair endonuclease